MTELGYTEDLPRPCNVAIQATIASIRAAEIHQAIQEHERTALTSQQEEEPGQFLMKLLGLDEWFNIYLLAQQSGVQMALQQLRDYAAFLDDMEGDDAYELQQALALARAMDVALTKVAVATDNAKNGVLPTPPSIPVLPPVTPGPLFSLFSKSVISSSSPLDTIVVDSLLTTNPAPICPLSSSSENTPSSEILSPNLSIHSLLSGSPSAPPNTPVMSPVLDDSPSFDLCSSIKSSQVKSSIKGNPLLDLTWLTEDELIEMNVAISVVDYSPLLVEGVEEPVAGEPYVPVLPPRHIEWECSKEDGCMWKIKNINNLAPLSIAMWQAWGTVSDAEVLQCRDRALNAITISDKPPMFVSHWPMTVFGPPKYKCLVAAGQLIWLDHAVWYMLHHLEDFFNASSIQGRLVMLIKFLSGDARRMVLDHIAFLYVREFLVEATQELIDHPEERFFAQYESSCGLRMIEALVKPGMFSEKLDSQRTGTNKKRLNLNAQPAAAARRRGIYANPTVVPGLGRGGTSRAPSGLLPRLAPGNNAGRQRPSRGQTLPGLISPLQRRNITF
ncbi:unnamed protein product [Calypogeia fissa]